MALSLCGVGTDQDGAFPYQNPLEHNFMVFIFHQMELKILKSFLISHYKYCSDKHIVNKFLGLFHKANS